MAFNQVGLCAVSTHACVKKPFEVGIEGYLALLALAWVSTFYLRRMFNNRSKKALLCWVSQLCLF